MNIYSKTTRSFSFDGIDEYGNKYYGEEQLAIDAALQQLAYRLFGKPCYSGAITTSWHRGGMREPQIPGWNKSWEAKHLKEQLPENFSGRAVWHLNNGELSGSPRLTK